MVVHRVLHVFSMEYLWRMSQRCYSVVSPWCTKVIGHQLTQFRMHSAKLQPYTEARTTDEAHQANRAPFSFFQVGHARVRSMGVNLGV